MLKEIFQGPIRSILLSGDNLEIYKFNANSIAKKSQYTKHRLNTNSLSSIKNLYFVDLIVLIESILCIFVHQSKHKQSNKQTNAKSNTNTGIASLSSSLFHIEQTASSSSSSASLSESLSRHLLIHIRL
jgi:hypothetical protein